MQKRTKVLLALGILAFTAAREFGLLDFSIARTTSNFNTSTYSSPGEAPERAYNAFSVDVFEAGEGEAAFHADPTGDVKWILVLDEPEFGGLDWLPLYKRMTYRIGARAGNLETVTVDGVKLPGKPEDGSPHGFSYTTEGVITAIGMKSRHSLREDVLKSVLAEVEEEVTEFLQGMEPKEEAEDRSEPPELEASQG